ncbi:hypothetical protein PVAND_000817 [Polypedilum vanderplanki]|uniref:Ubiquitin-like domain-containing CTD phosphatase 1 n=1 Tax=Polypedilum vanderplanki TaxID=319348 RepID=A0A9J6BM80_POLVA|nr:hypothetical protein PVAND_000817 [Polypedilum vanderplanki]
MEEEIVPESCKKARIEETMVKVAVKWNNTMYNFELDDTDDIQILRYMIYRETNVRQDRQKILNLKGKGGIKITESSKIIELDIKEGKCLMMVGSREEDIASIVLKPDEMDEVLNDFDEPDQESESYEKKEVYLAKIRRRIKDYKIEEFNKPRPGKKLLVLDIDYTLFDHRSSAENGHELMRPYLHEFLTSAYEHYDIVIWSATSMKWIIEKMKLLGVHNNENYKILFYLDYNAMITVHYDKRVVEVKPLMVIWGKYQEWSSKNTIMFDDIRRNFLMNPKCGLRIAPFRNCHLNRAKDKELLKLATYLKKIAENCDDFNKLNHRKWESYQP